MTKVDECYIMMMSLTHRSLPDVSSCGGCGVCVVARSVACCCAAHVLFWVYGVLYVELLYGSANFYALLSLDNYRFRGSEECSLLTMGWFLLRVNLLQNIVSEVFCTTHSVVCLAVRLEDVCSPVSFRGLHRLSAFTSRRFGDYVPKIVSFCDVEVYFIE